MEKIIVAANFSSEQSLQLFAAVATDAIEARGSVNCVSTVDRRGSHGYLAMESAVVCDVRRCLDYGWPAPAGM